MELARLRASGSLGHTPNRMNKFSRKLGLALIGFQLFIARAPWHLSAQVATNFPAAMPPNYLKTNGENVTIGGIMVKTNSPLNTDYFKQFMWRESQVWKLGSSKATNATDQMVAGAWGLIKDYPKEVNGYQILMAATDDYGYLGEPAKARAVANELIASPAPENFKVWMQGFLNRLDAHGKPVELKFTAVDGRAVDLAQLRGKVVLVDFWSTHCGPCVAELPRVKAAYEKFHEQGFEVVGISCDTDKKDLKDYVQRHGIPWPQYFDSQQQTDNKFTVAFGIDGIPHMFLVDKKGSLRFDDVRANDHYHPKDETAGFEETIAKLLAEN